MGGGSFLSNVLVSRSVLWLYRNLLRLRIFVAYITWFFIIGVSKKIFIINGI